MKKYIAIIFCMLGSLIFQSCNKDSGTGPKEEPGEDYSFPTLTKFSVTVYSNQIEYKTGDDFEVKLVFYNMQSVFGAAVELLYDSSFVEISDSSKILIGPYFQVGDSTLIFKKVEQLGRVNLGISYIKGSGLVSNGSGVVMKLRCKALKAGSTSFLLNEDKLEIRKSDGTYISNFSSLIKENLILNIQ